MQVFSKRTDLFKSMDETRAPASRLSLSLGTRNACIRRLSSLGISPWASSRVVTAVLTAVFLAQGWLYGVYQVRRQGPVPVNREERDTYLRQYLPSYPAYRFLNELAGSSYTVYALLDENMAYFADGRFMGDHFGPARYRLITSKLTDSPALYRQLRQWGVDYFLVSRRVVRFALPDDEFFHSHFKLIYGRAHVLLFQLSEAPWRRRIGPELLQNPGFEELEEGQPKGWGRGGTPRVDSSGRYSHTGRTAVLARGAENVFFQVVRVKPGTPYQLRLYARGLVTGQATRLQVNWSDAQGHFLSTDIEVVPVGLDWKPYEIVVTAPEDGALATIYTSPHERSVVWYDDFSFVEIQYERSR